MFRNLLTVSITAGICLLCGQAQAQSQTEKEVLQALLQNYEYTNKNLKGAPDAYSKHGALEFWSSGGLMQEIKSDTPPEEYEVFSVGAKHVRIITLVEGQAAVAVFYAEGVMKPLGAPGVTHYLTRGMEVFVKEDGKWKVRASHWSPVVAGSGTSQIVP